MVNSTSRRFLSFRVIGPWALSVSLLWLIIFDAFGAATASKIPIAVRQTYKGGGFSEISCESDKICYFTTEKQPRRKIDMPHMKADESRDYHYFPDEVTGDVIAFTVPCSEEDAIFIGSTNSDWAVCILHLKSIGNQKTFTPISVEINISLPTEQKKKYRALVKL